MTTTAAPSTAPVRTMRELEDDRTRAGRDLADRLEADLGVDLDALAADDTVRREYEAQLVADAIFGSADEARVFVGHVLAAVRAGSLTENLARWVADTREVVAQLAALRERRDRVRALALRRERLEERVATAARTLSYETDRLALYPRLDDVDGSLVDFYISNFAGHQDYLPALLVTNNRETAAFRELLENRILPELERRLKAAQDDLARFMEQDGAELLG